MRLRRGRGKVLQEANIRWFILDAHGVLNAKPRPYARARHGPRPLVARLAQSHHLAAVMDRPPLLLSPYDAELFGHWWYEGPEFLDYFVRKAYFDQKVFSLITPEDYLRAHA